MSVERRKPVEKADQNAMESDEPSPLRQTRSPEPAGNNLFTINGKTDPQQFNDAIYRRKRRASPIPALLGRSKPEFYLAEVSSTPGILPRNVNEWHPCLSLAANDQNPRGIRVYLLCIRDRSRTRPLSHQEPMPG